MPGLPAGVKFDPTDQELLEHLEGQVKSDSRKIHPLIDEFIPTIEGENGICYTHPEKLPGENITRIQPFLVHYSVKIPKSSSHFMIMVNHINLGLLMFGKLGYY